MAYYLQMIQSLNPDMNAMPVISLNALNGQPVRWHSALGHQVPVTSTAQSHPRRLSAVLRANLNRVDAYLQPVTRDLQSPSYAPDVWKENLQKQLLETVDQGEQIKEWINTIKGYFRSMTMGNISVSPYDTAWVALVPALDGSGGPQFPKSLQWIIDNQLPDGNWGEPDLFLGFDRACNTLACVIALKTWGCGAENVERGLEFIRLNLGKIEEDDPAHMPIGFEIVFPAMLEEAKALGLDLPYESPILQSIHAARAEKMKKIPMEILHNYPTTLLHSLEGLHKDVDWEKLLRLQCANGSFLFSPASTACALAYTKDEKCLDYLNKLLLNFDNAVPNVHPVDLFERLWIVDRLERLGVSRHFKQEIKDALEYVYRYWTDFGIGWASNSIVQDVDDTAMGFRLLRLHGFDVSEDCFRQFYKGGEFFCFAGQTGQAVTGMFNFYRASQILFPGETLLEKGRSFTKTFLENKHAKGECHDKWILTKDLDGEVDYALNFPWYASLSRIEHRTYLDHYGTNDIWIGKSLYKMPYVNNELFLDLAKADFNMCQSIHQKELEELIRWNAKCNFKELQFARQKSVECYFSAAATMFEPEMAKARLVWARCCVLTTVLDDYFDVGGTIEELRLFLEAVKRWDSTLVEGLSAKAKVLFSGLYNTVNSISQEAYLVQGRDVSHHLRYFWERWLTSTLTESEWVESNYVPTMQEYMKVAEPSIALEPIVLSTLFFVPGELLSDEVIASYDYYHVMQLVNHAGRLLNDIQGFKRELGQGKKSSVGLYMIEHPEITEVEAIAQLQNKIDNTMQQLNWEVIRPTSVPSACKQLHFNMARIMNVFYRRTDGFSSPTEMAGLVKKVLFEVVS
ncbi:hypothetical protein BDL97_03G057700 [Sphagnum fallax]|nr:hypothetical protein BDL97_03G057700 [Sphagnum fallax]